MRSIQVFTEACQYEHHQSRPMTTTTVSHSEALYTYCSVCTPMAGNDVKHAIDE